MPHATAKSIDELSEERQTVTYYLLSDRLVAWRSLIKMLIKYVREVARAKSAVAKAHTKAAELLSIPSGNYDQFLQSDGILQVMSEMQRLSRTIAADEATSANTMDLSIIKELRRMKVDIKRKAKAILANTSLENRRLSRDEAVLSGAILKLGRCIDTAESAKAEGNGYHIDPWLANHSVRRHIDHHIGDKVAVQQKMLAELESFTGLENNIFETLRATLKSFSSMWENDLQSQQAIVATALCALGSLQGNVEWEAFTTRHKGRLVKRNPEQERDRAILMDQVVYDNRDHKYCSVVKTGTLMRKRPIAGWKESYWVLTGAGWLHSFNTPDILRHQMPEKSIYIAGSVLGAHSLDAEPNGFEVIERGGGGLFHKRECKHRLRARSRAEAMEWWNALQTQAESVLDRFSSAQSVTQSAEEMSAAAARHAAELAGITEVERSEENLDGEHEHGIGRAPDGGLSTDAPSRLHPEVPVHLTKRNSLAPEAVGHSSPVSAVGDVMEAAEGERLPNQNQIIPPAAPEEVEH